MRSGYRITLDRVGFDHKPEGREIAGITRRMQEAGPAEVTPDELARAIAGGSTWCGGCFEPSASGWGEFRGMQLFGIDVDNKTELLDESGEKVKDERGRVVQRPVMPDESGYLDPWEFLARFNKTFHRDPLMMHETFSFAFDRTLEGRWNPETRMCYRVIFDAGESIADRGKAEAVLARLLDVFPEADRACKNVNRLLFGTRGRVVLFGDDGARYYHGR